VNLENLVVLKIFFGILVLWWLVAVFQETYDWQVVSFFPRRIWTYRSKIVRISNGDLVRLAWNDACLAAMHVVSCEKD